jgi:hypothetical protein
VETLERNHNRDICFDPVDGLRFWTLGISRYEVEAMFFDGIKEKD